MKKKCGLLLTLFMSVCMTCAVTGSTVREEQGYVIDMHTEQQCERLCENYDIALESDEEGELARQAILVADSDEITKEDIHTIKAEYSAIVEPDYVMEAAYKTAKSDESGCEDYGDTWNLKMIHAEQLTDRVLKPIKVAVIDSGIDFTEELNVTGRKNVVDEGYVVPLYEDITGHGTGIAGIIAARETGNGIRGINPYCELYSVKILDDNNKAPMSRVIQAIYWCIDNDIDIIHMSFGMPQYSEILHKAVQDAAEADILMIASAGNNGKNTCYPAAYEEVVSVGAVSSSGELSVFDPDSMELVAPGEKVDTTSFYGGIMTVGGTSIAAAHVTGIASVLWGIDPDKPASFIRRLMQQTAVQTEEMQKRGCGLPDLEYAIIMYDAFCQTEQDKSVSENTISENTVSENTISGNFVSLQNDREVESFEEPDAVEGMWHNDNTDDNKGIHQVDAETYGNTILHLNQTEMKILRYYAGYPDVLTQEDKLHSIEESDEYPDQLKELAEKNSETIDFVYDYPEMKDKKQTIDLSQEAKTDTVPLLLQWDERWGYMPYSGGLLGYTGCGPTNLAMVVLYLTGDKTVTPASVAEYAESAGYSVPGSGSSWTLISEGCEHYGIHAEEVPMDEDRIKAKLDEGCLIIINVGPGDFTDSGHFITIIGYDRDGFIINDSNSRTNSKKRWSYEQLSRQMRNLWAMYN